MQNEWLRSTHKGLFDEVRDYAVLAIVQAATFAAMLVDG